MDCSKTPWSAICMGLHKDVSSIDSQAAGLHSFDMLSVLLRTTETQNAKIRRILAYCDKRFPNLISELSGNFKDEEDVTGQAVGDASGAGPSKRPHPYQVLRDKRRKTGVALLSLAKLCVTHLIYPPIFFSELLRHLLSQGMTPKYGSGLFSDSPSAMVCANLGELYSTSCQKPARLPCPRCQLQSYCSDKCRKAHWKFEHKNVCPKALQDASQLLEKLRQTYANIRQSGETVHPSPQIVWDRVPAFGLLHNVQEDTSVAARELPNPLRLLIADCFDLNNVIETVHQLDPQFRGEATLHINTSSMHCLARHIILWSLLLDMAEKRIDTSAVDAVIAIWYSANLTPSQYLLLMDTVLRLLNTTTILPSQTGLDTNVFLLNSDLNNIQEDMQALSKVYNKLQLDGILRQIPGSGSSMYLRTQGLELWKYLTLMGISCWDPNQATREVTLCKYDRLDAAEAYLLEPQLYALDAFRLTGLALPFSTLAYGNHSIPNPTLASPIDNPRAGWAVRCRRYDPLSGWPINEVMKSTRGAPCHVPDNDLFGSQYFYVRTRILSAVERLRNCRVAVEFTGYTDSCDHIMGVMNKGPGMRSVYRVYADFHPRSGSVSTLPLKVFLAAFSGLLTGDHSRLIMLHHVSRVESVGFRSADMDEDQVDFASSNFDRFISKFSDKFAEKLREYSKAIKENRCNINKLIPLFMRHGPYHAELYSTIQKACAARSGDIVPFSLTTISNLRAVPVKPSMVFGHPLDQEAGTSKQGKKSGKNSITTAEECYMQVFLTVLTHFEVFLEVEPTGNVADWFQRRTEPEVAEMSVEIPDCKIV